jgi:tRNA(Ile)-lysidine synthase
VYIDHGLRPESGEEGQYVCEFAAELGGIGVVKSVEIPPQASLEAAARDARYLALEALAQEQGADWILLGHTSSDQVETILMRILRGTGLVGLSGMAKERGRLARPLLEFPRQATEKYCREHKLRFHEDSMNRDSKFTRVRMRHHWLPELRKENPQVDEALLNLAASARDHREVLDWAAQGYLHKSVDEAGALRLGPDFQILPDSLAVRILVLHAASAGVSGLERRHLSELLDFARKEESGTRSLCLPGARARRTYSLLEWNPVPSERSSVNPIAGHKARRWRAGDRMRPERLKGRSRKLSDLFADSKVPKELRPLAWVLERTDDGEIVWAEHIGYAFGCQLSVTLGQVPSGSAK